MVTLRKSFLNFCYALCLVKVKMAMKSVECSSNNLVIYVLDLTIQLMLKKVSTQVRINMFSLFFVFL